jgi:hypothetical protein
MFFLTNIFTITLMIEFTVASVEALSFGFRPLPPYGAFQVNRRHRGQHRYCNQQHSYCYKHQHQSFKFRRKIALYSMSPAKSSPSQKQQRAMDDRPSRKGSSAKVIFQKIVRPPSGMVDTLLLGYLVEFLQEQFTLPDRLPMTYSISTTHQATTREPIVQWNSPLSPNPMHTALSVHIVGIYGDASDDGRNDADVSSRETAPNMAMVVLEKSSSALGPDPPLPPMLANLFSDSERQIVRALDRGLDEFMLGLTRPKQKPKDTVASMSELSYDNQLTLEENAISAAKMLHETFDDKSGAPPLDQSQESKPLLARLNGIIDANITQRNGVNVVAETDLAALSSTGKEGAAAALREMQREAALQSMMHKKSSQNLSSLTSTASPELEGLDFAVQAARIAHAKRQLKYDASVNSTDYAVQAALLVAAQRRLSPLQRNDTLAFETAPNSSCPPLPKGVGSAKVNAQNNVISDCAASVLPEITSLRSPMLDPRLVSSNQPKGRTFMSTISTPSSFLKEKNAATDVSYQRKANASLPLGSQAVSLDVESVNLTTLQTNRSINLKIQEYGTNADTGMSLAEKGPNVSEQQKIVQATLDALNEVAESGKDMTPEELLDEVMRYGDDQDRQQQVGAGFVSAAFEKAKALLRDQTKRREERMQFDPPVYPTSSYSERGTLDERSEFVTERKIIALETISPSEELRRMFEAGERLAGGRITTAINNNDSSTMRGRSTTDQDIDELIESDKTVPRHARVLDDELTELMVRINKSPGEETDGPNGNPLFDIFSGPEVYDQNVDPLTAVNWPGALPGSKSIRLPKDLNEAVRQAKFAAKVLFNLREEESKDGLPLYSVGTREITAQQVSNLRVVVEEAVEIGLIDDPFLLQEEESRLEMVLNEMIHQPEERMREITSNYKDLLLSDNFVGLVRKRLNQMADRDLDALRRGDDSLELVHAREREVLGHLVAFAQLLLKEVQALGAELESQQLEVIRSICKVAMDPSHRTEEEAAMALTDAVRDMRPLFDDGFIAYLKYAVAEEEGRLARAGLLNDPEHTQWLYVLKIIQQGVHAEIGKGINRLLEHIWYVLRMETPVERRMLLEKLVDVMPTLDVRPFVQVVDNIVGSLGDSVRGDFDGATTLGEMTNKLLQLRRDLKEILPPERLAKKSRDADEWVAKQKQRLLEQRKLTKQRLKAAQDTEHLDSTIESFGKNGEVERFE